MTPAVVTERALAGLRWLTVSGAAEPVFRTLGQVAAADIAATLDGMPERAALADYVRRGTGRSRLESVTAATLLQHSDEVDELRALSAGAGVPFRDLLLVNLRGDLGVPDGTGCTDLAWPGGGGFLAHNEDGAPALADHLMIITLLVDGRPPVTVHWYPGFVPSNTVVATGAGLVWGINHIQARVPAAAPGRHFVARGLQQQTTLERAATYLRTHPSAGGFAYTIGDYATGTIALIEATAGEWVGRTLDDDGALHWHTNHLRFLDGQLDSASLPEIATDADADGTKHLGTRAESVTRGVAVEALGPPTPPYGAWLGDALAGRWSPGIHRTAASGDPLMTLTTTVTDLAEGSVTVHSHRGATETLPLDAYLGRVP